MPWPVWSRSLPVPATPSLGAATLIGAVGGVLVVLAVPFFDKLKIDDVVGALSVHLVCGIWGTMAVPITNAEASFVTQFIGVAAIGAFVVVVLLRLSGWPSSTPSASAAAEEDEYRGLDLAEIGMEAYPDFQTVHLGGMGSPSANFANDLCCGTYGDETCSPELIILFPPRNIRSRGGFLSTFLFTKENEGMKRLIVNCIGTNLGTGICKHSRLGRY